jgi:hypothetical protein
MFQYGLLGVPLYVISARNFCQVLSSIFGVIYWSAPAIFSLRSPKFNDNRTYCSWCNAKNKNVWVNSGLRNGSPRPHQLSSEFRFREPSTSGDLCGGIGPRSGHFAEMWDVASSVNNSLLRKCSSAFNRRHITIENSEGHAAVRSTDDRCSAGIISGTSVWCFGKWYEAHLFPMTNVLRTSKGFLA